MTPTPAPTIAPTATPAPTPTPLPTPTPAPRLIGAKTAGAKFIYLTNSTGKQIRQINLKVSGADDWGNSLFSKESSVKAAEQVRMYYKPQEGAVYDMRFLDGNGNSYEIYSVELSDMERASLKYDEENGILYLTYISLSAKSEKDTKDNAVSYDQDNGDYDYQEEVYYYEDNNQGNGGSDGGNSEDGGDGEDIYYEDDDGYIGDDGEGEGFLDGDDVIWDESGDWNEE